MDLAEAVRQYLDDLPYYDDSAFLRGQKLRAALKEHNEGLRKERPFVVYATPPTQPVNTWIIGTFN